MAAPLPSPRVHYERRRPERTALYELVRDNLETLYGAITDGAAEVRIGKHAKKELEGYLECGVLGRGFGRLRCGECKETRVVAFSCKGRGFCPSCTGRRMCQTVANLIELTLAAVGTVYDLVTNGTVARAGDAVTLSFYPGQLYAFDVTTGVVPGGDGGVGGDGGTNPTDPVGEDGGCSCNAVGSSEAGSASGIALAVAGIAMVRRRKR